LENKSKAETFIGFAMRTGKFRIGTNAVQTLKRAYLMIVCSSASQNTKEQAEKIAKKFHCQLIETASATLEQLTHRENAKVMAIADKNLSVAILENMEKDFIARI
jgi:ribosomal protein L7Ae-like RNA K-turn-binding protein